MSNPPPPPPPPPLPSPSRARSIDLNCDLGESDDRVRDGTDRALLESVSSANIACGGHAGDEFTMTETARTALERGVAIGAHPGYPDRANFGRSELDMSPEQIEASVVAQIGALDRVARSLGSRLVHVKPHGALYHAAMTREPVARAIARAAGRAGGDLVLVGLAGAPAIEVWRGMGCRAAAEAFADRCYEPDGSLRSRSLPGALIDDPGGAAAQAVRIARGQGVIASGGAVVPVRADTVCIHGDTPGAARVARGVRAALERYGVRIAGLRAA